VHLSSLTGLPETCYTLNYVVQERQDDNPWNLWGIRRIAVYQKFSYDDQSSTWILLHPSERIRQWVQESLQAQSERTSVSCAQKALETHMAFFSNSAENWRTYYKFLERYLIEKVGCFPTTPQDRITDILVQTACAYICDVSTPEMAATATKQVWGVKFQDLQNLHKFEEKLYELQRSLDTNSEAIHALVRLNNDIRDFGSASEKDGKYWYRVNHALEQYRHEIGLQQRNIDNFLKRISGRSQLVFQPPTLGLLSRGLTLKNSSSVTSRNSIPLRLSILRCEKCLNKTAQSLQRSIRRCEI
jgi:hypothetical protein